MFNGLVLGLDVGAVPNPVGTAEVNPTEVPTSTGAPAGDTVGDGPVGPGEGAPPTDRASTDPPLPSPTITEAAIPAAAT